MDSPIPNLNPNPNHRLLHENTMKASIKFREDQKPLLRAKIPINILNFPFRSGVAAGESKELSLNLSTFFDSGPSLKFSYRPNDSHNPFSFIFKTGIGHFGSPNKSPFSMSAEFNLLGNQNPSFFIRFAPNCGDFSLKKSYSSGFVKNFVDNGESCNGFFNGSSFFPPTVESKTAAGLLVNRAVAGTELSARTAVPLLDFAMVKFRWGLRFPSQEAARDESDAVLVDSYVNRTVDVKLPLLVMNKIGIEHVAKRDLKKGNTVGPGDAYENLAKVCLDVKKQLEVTQAENGLLSKALADLRSEMAAGKMELWRNKSSGGGGGDPIKKSFEAIGEDAVKVA